MKVGHHGLSAGKIAGLGLALYGAYTLLDTSFAPTPATNAKEFTALKEEVARLRNALYAGQVLAPEGTPLLVLRDELGSLRADVSNLQRQILDLASAGQPAGDVDLDRASPLDEDMEADAAQAEQQFFASVESQLSQEVVDSNWSMNASETISKAFEQSELSEYSVSVIDCRSTLCRVDIVIDENQNANIGELPMRLLPVIVDSFPGFSMQVPDDPDSSTTVVYLSSEKMM